MERAQTEPLSIVILLSFLDVRTTAASAEKAQSFGFLGFTLAWGLGCSLGRLEAAYSGGLAGQHGHEFELNGLALRVGGVHGADFFAVFGHFPAFVIFFQFAFAEGE